MPEAAQGVPTATKACATCSTRMCTRTPRAEADGGAFKFSQIKEKQSQGRRALSEAEAQVEEAIALAEARSATSCEPIMAAGG